jgi:hypothetical protein
MNPMLLPLFNEMPESFQPTFSTFTFSQKKKREGNCFYHSCFAFIYARFLSSTAAAPTIAMITTAAPTISKVSVGLSASGSTAGVGVGAIV